LSLETEFVNVESYEINESGTICIEKAWDKFTLEFEENSINLQNPYEVEGLTVKQGDITIPLENESQINYFKEVIKELSNGDNKS
jgi:hypothetical protein